MRVAVLHSGDTRDMKGIMNYVHEKAFRLQHCHSHNICCDVFCVRQEYTRLFTWLILRKKYQNNNSHPSSEIIGGVTYNLIWIKYGLYDCFVSNKLFRHLISFRYYNRFQKKLKGYDVITSHNLECHQIALRLSQYYSKPLVCTWHGSDIHTLPFQKRAIMEVTRMIIENAGMNYFVSKNLLDLSEKITSRGKKRVIYTGPASGFRRYSHLERLACRNRLLEDADFIIGFVGNLFPVKNVLVLPEVLSLLRKKLPDSSKLSLVVVGDGPLKDQLECGLTEKNITAIFLGNTTPQYMPMIMNGLDMLILPSRNEGLPLVTLEALKCGVNVVGSKVGGIPEVIGLKNCFELDSSFVENISTRMAEILLGHEVAPNLPDFFSWESATEEEVKMYIKLYHDSSNSSSCL